MKQEGQRFTLYRCGDLVMIRRAGQAEAVPVRVVRARPLAGHCRAISILHATEKKELLLLESLEHVDASSRAIIEQELARRYFLPRITRVLQTRVSFGNCYWKVETDRGPKHFLMKSPETNTTWVTDDRCILRDTLGNCYEIPSLQALDSASRRRVEAVL